MKMIIAVVEKFQYFNLVPGGWVGGWMGSMEPEMKEKKDRGEMRKEKPEL